MRIKMAEGVCQNETEIRDVIYEYLKRRNYLVWRDRQPPRQMKRGFTPDQKGVSDILGMTSKGLFVAIEVKKPGGTLSIEQQRFLQEVNERGGIGFIATSLDDVRLKGL